MLCWAYTHTQGKESLIESIPVLLNRIDITVALNRLAHIKSYGRARELYCKLMSSWGRRPDREQVTVKLAQADVALLRKLKLPDRVFQNGMLQSGWIVTYQHPRNPQLEVTVHTQDKPLKRRTFQVGGKKRRLTAVHVKRIKPQEAKVAARTRKGKAKQEEELDELEGLEDLEDLEDEDLEDEEPEDEEDEDEEDEDEEPAPKRRGRAAAKKAPAKKSATKSRSRKAAEPEEDEDEDEDEEPAPRRRTSKSKTTAKGKTAEKSTAKKTAAKAKGNGKSEGGLSTTRELPKGRVGPQEIADMVGGNCDARYVRIWLRDSDYEREDGSRWSFNKTDARTIAKEIKADRKGN